ncbi:MAG: phosphate ABC transporter permease PstA [Eubacterium sp.]|jgi:phosphate transport system permease protein|nr:phosphate ABC transporter permease protein PstA [Clostridium sp. CAG:167]
MELKSKIRIRFILFRALVILLTVAVAGLAAGLIGYILKKGLPYVSWEFLTTEPDILMDTYGIKPMIINTIYTVVLTLLFCIPLGIGSAIYLAEYAKQGKIVSAIRFAIEILAGIPSIVYGLFGLDFFVRKMSIGDYAGSMLAASLTLTLIVLPTMIRTTEESLLAVSSSYREAAAAMGLSKFYTIRKVILPCAISGIVVAIILSIGRMISESAALLYTAGIAQDLPTSVLSHVKEPGATMTVQLYLYATEGGAPEWVPYAMAAVLMLFVLFIEILTHLIAGIFARRKKG